mgnify:CR=1 FL=1
MQETIEILSVDLLDQHRPLVERLRALARSLKLEFGWHYLLDLTWIISRLGDVQGKRIMDAGAGTGVLQWYLAEEGAQVLSVDRISRADLPLRFRRRFRVKGLRRQDLAGIGEAVLRSLDTPGRLARLICDLPALAKRRGAAGSVTIYHQDLCSLVDIPSESLDAVVAVSALEHNNPEELALVVVELLRVLKPGGLLLATLGAARDRDWFHEPSQGWCYTEASLCKIFNLPIDTPTNYSHYNELIAALRECAELRDNLASFYFRSGDNGMPWGKWDPQYQPVGVCKVKR